MLCKVPVIPTQAGIHCAQQTQKHPFKALSASTPTGTMDSRLRGNDKEHQPKGIFLSLRGGLQPDAAISRIDATTPYNPLVIPAQAGIHCAQQTQKPAFKTLSAFTPEGKVDSRLRGNDKAGL